MEDSCYQLRRTYTQILVKYFRYLHRWKPQCVMMLSKPHLFCFYPKTHAHLNCFPLMLSTPNHSTNMKYIIASFYLNFFYVVALLLL